MSACHGLGSQADGGDVSRRMYLRWNRPYSLPAFRYAGTSAALLRSPAQSCSLRWLRLPRPVLFPKTVRVTFRSVPALGRWWLRGTDTLSARRIGGAVGYLDLGHTIHTTSRNPVQRVLGRDWARLWPCLRIWRQSWTHFGSDGAAGFHLANEPGVLDALDPQPALSVHRATDSF